MNYTTINTSGSDVYIIKYYIISSITIVTLCTITCILCCYKSSNTYNYRTPYPNPAEEIFEV